jgi:hypothetical protein
MGTINVKGVIVGGLVAGLILNVRLAAHGNGPRGS